MFEMMILVLAGKSGSVARLVEKEMAQYVKGVTKGKSK